MSDGASLSRFVQAQAGVYRQALGELREGEKRSHWMWFIFPQVEGLGTSRTAQLYGIRGRGEAEAYAAHDLLFPRLVECTQAMLGWAGKRNAAAVLGPIDTLKFASSMTLFEACSPDPAPFAAALDAFNRGERDAATLERL